MFLQSERLIETGKGPYIFWSTRTKMYLKTDQGDECYTFNSSNEPVYVKSENGSERYARDRENNEYYPPRYVRPAKASDGTYVYAKNKFGDEIYPEVDGVEMPFRNRRGFMVAARYFSGKQRYPRDAKKNEFAPTNESNNPRYLMDESGKLYYPRTRNGRIIFMTNLGSLDKLENQSFFFHLRDVLSNGICTDDPAIFENRYTILKVLAFSVLLTSEIGFMILLAYAQFRKVL